MATPDVTIATYLGAQIASLTLATNLFHGPLHPGSPLAVFCILNSGPKPFMHCAATYEKFSNVQIIVQGKPNLNAAAKTLAREVWTTLHGKNALDASWIDMLMLESEPQYLGQDDDDHHLWQMTAQVHANASL